MAPEQAAGNPELIDDRTDVYGLGAMLYEILTGKTPFSGADQSEVLRKIQEEEPIRPRQLRSVIPTELEAICLRAMAKKPQDRYASAAELARQVQQWLAERAKEPFKKMAALQRRAHEQTSKTRKQLMEEWKFAVLGHAVAGVTHEINNPLGLVINDLAVLRREVHAMRDLIQLYQQANPAPSDHNAAVLERIRELAERIDLGRTLGGLDEVLNRSADGLHRIQQIVKDFRNFAVGKDEFQETDLNVGVQSTIRLIRGRARKLRIEVETELVPLPLVYCVPSRINQVVLNLLTNAMDACPEGGKVTVRTRIEADGVAIHVLDTGCGIDPAIRDQIFEPFFTTKSPDQGVGLGLAISREIVHGHGGRIEVESALGHGSHFTVTLPLRPPMSGVLELIRSFPTRVPR
jgi:two-component system, NtrC family, sensor kinase